MVQLIVNIKNIHVTAFESIFTASFLHETMTFAQYFIRSTFFFFLRYLRY